MTDGRLLNKYKDMDFYYPDDEVNLTVYSINLTYVKKVRGQKGSRNGWVLIGTHPDDDNDDKIQSFIISYFLVYLVTDTKQAARVKVLQWSYDGGSK